MNACIEPLLSTPGTLPIATLAVDDSAWIVFGIVAVLWLAFSFVQKTIHTITRERTRREIAAYIAEGSMTPEQGEKLMKSGEGPNPHH